MESNLSGREGPDASLSKPQPCLTRLFSHSSWAGATAEAQQSTPRCALTYGAPRKISSCSCLTRMESGFHLEEDPKVASLG